MKLSLLILRDALHSLLPSVKTMFVFIQLIFLAFPLLFPEGIKTKSVKGMNPSGLETCLLYNKYF